VKTINCRIAVDAMGGDYAPLNVVMGALDALDQSDFKLLLVGKKDEVIRIAAENDRSLDNCEIIDSQDVISMKDSPTVAVRQKKNSSIVIGAKLVKEGKADAFVSAGNTGAMVMSSIMNIGRISGVSRPTLTAPLPNEKNTYTFLSDVGAFVDSKPQHLLSFAQLSSIFVREVYEISSPKIGLLNVGEEESKGYALTSDTKKLLDQSNLNFIGNVEGKDIFKGSADIIICDGFIGNILLKFAESIIPFLKAKFKDYASKSLTNKLRTATLRTPFKEALKSANYELAGGLPLLGIDGISIIGHGSSTALAIKNMVLQAKLMYDKNLVQKIKEALK